MRGMVILVVTLAAAGIARAETPCDDCWTDKCTELKGIVPKCKGAPPKKKEPPPKETPKEAPAETCPAGKERNVDTAGHCCWAGQAWNGAKCVGIPALCPSGLNVDTANETCALPECEEGQKRAYDGIHCCWPGQAWSSSASQCLGSPQCEKGWALEEGRCISPRALQERADAQKRLEEENARRTAEEAARIKAAEDERRRVEAEAEAARIEAEQRAAAARAEQEAAEAQARAEQEAREAAAREAQRAYEERKASAEFQRGLAQTLGGLSLASIAVGGLTTLGGVVTNAEIASGSLDTASDITETAERGQFFNTIAWGTLIGGGAGLLGAGIWLAVSGEPEAP